MTTILEKNHTLQSLKNDFLEKVASKQITVGVIGLGYVGYPLALSFAESNVRVVGFDIDTKKIEAIERNESYIHYISEERLHLVREKNFLKATTDFSQVAQCDALIICVPTPLNEHLEPDLTYITETCKSLAPHLTKNTLISLESTTWPGTSDEVVKPLLEEGSGLTVGKELYLCFSPEREDPGNQKYKCKNTPKLLGGYNEDSQEIGKEVYSLIVEEVVTLSSMGVAEAAKLFENIFRSVNIALVNEMKVILDKMGISVWEVIHAASTKPFGFMPFWPGPGLGGHCIPIDPFYLSWKAKEFGITTRFIELAGEINRGMPKFVIEKVQDCLNQYGKPVNGSKILILGLSYKADIDDMRESPSLELTRLLEAKGAQVDYHDPYFPEIGPTREYMELQGRKSQELSSNYDCFLIATKHSCFSAEKVLSYNVPVVDTRNLIPRQEHVFQA
ncbi:MAG: UDP-N-acetyl-D-glucosamine 6-dehydrogenase [Chlamydiae bacterium]|nr:UDP-N-acetyl-D-glucosamine 6-dehydrogenase [Chlamydiota bacterium]